MMKKLLVFLLFVSCTLAYGQKKEQSGSDAWTGTFKLDTAQSKFAGAAPKEEMVTVDSATKASVKYTIKGIDAQGNSYTLSYDGKVGTQSPQMLEGKEVAQVTYQMPSAHEFTSEVRGADGTASKGKVTLSKDNKTITVQEQIKDTQGGTHDQTAVYVRQ
jgi:hypothetical protein